MSVVPCRVQRLVLDGDGGGDDVDGGEEFVETRYYDGLIRIDKQHHTVKFSCTCEWWFVLAAKSLVFQDSFLG